MKKILSVLITSTTLTTAALSNAGPASMPTPCPACPVAAAPCWAGFKFGLQMGYGQHGSKHNFRVQEGNGQNPSIYRRSLKTTVKGAMGGLHAGYDFQFANMWLVGVNASFDVNALKGKSSFREEPVEIISTRVNSQYTFAVVPRVGLVMNDSLFYVGVGWVGSSWKTKTRALDNAFRRNSSEFLNGMRVSVGAAQKMKQFVLGVEVNYDSYGSISTRATNVADSFKTSFKPHMLSGTVKLSYLLCNKAN